MVASLQRSGAGAAGGAAVPEPGRVAASASPCPWGSPDLGTDWAPGRIRASATTSGDRLGALPPWGLACGLRCGVGVAGSGRRGAGSASAGAGGRLAGAVPPSARAGEGGRRRVALTLALGGCRIWVVGTEWAPGLAGSAPPRPPTASGEGAPERRLGWGH